MPFAPFSPFKKGLVRFFSCFHALLQKPFNPITMLN